MANELRLNQNSGDYGAVRRHSPQTDPDRLMAGFSAPEIMRRDELGAVSVLNPDLVALQLNPEEQEGYAAYLESGAALGEAA